VKTGPALDNLIAAIAEACRFGLEPAALRAEVLPRLRRAVPVDALWWATVDPATLLFTQAYSEEIPAETRPYFVENEFLGDDVNKWTQLAADAAGVRTLVEATDGTLEQSARYRDIFAPLGLEDELRAVLRARGAAWGFMCLHRERGGVFSRDDVAFMQRIVPHLAEGIRLGLLVQSLDVTELAESPGLILLAPDDSVIGTNAAADQWLDELNPPGTPGLPIEVHAVAGQLRTIDAAVGVPQLRVRTRAGRWAVVQASWLPTMDKNAVAVIIQQATIDQAAPVVMKAYGLTEQERIVSGLVFRGLSTQSISEQLQITQHTVQDHLKSIFEKTGVRSRRELVATVLRQRYLPRAKAGHPPSPSGYFAERDSST
jgi:DNA-binding CsgD family transcriptional regulator